MADQYELVNAAFSSKTSSKGMSRKDLARKILIDANYTGPLTAPAAKKSSGKSKNGGLSKGWTDLSNAQKVLATLMTPLRGVIGAASYATGNQTSSDNVIDAALDSMNLRPGSTKSGAELTRQLLPSLPDTYTGVLGFAADVGLDPLTYVPGAVIAAPFKALSKSTKAAGTAAEGAIKASSKARPPLPDLGVASKSRPSLTDAAARIDELSKVPSPVKVSDQLALESGAFDKVPGVSGQNVWLPKAGAEGPAIPITNPIEPSFGREASGQLTAFPKSRLQGPKVPAVADDLATPAPIEQDALFNFLPTATKNPTLVPNIGAIPGKIKKVKPGVPVTPVAEVPVPAPKSVKPAKSPAEAVKQEAKAAAKTEPFVPPHNITPVDAAAFKPERASELIIVPEKIPVKYGPAPKKLTDEQLGRMGRLHEMWQAGLFKAPFEANTAANMKKLQGGIVTSREQWNDLHQLFVKTKGKPAGPQVAQILFATRQGGEFAGEISLAPHVVDFIRRLGLDEAAEFDLITQAESLADRGAAGPLAKLLQGALKDAEVSNAAARKEFEKVVETKVVEAKTATPALDNVDADLAALGLADNMPVTPAALPDVAQAVDNAVADAAAPTARTTKQKTKEVLEVAAKVEATKTSVKEATKRELADALDAATVEKAVAKRVDEIKRAQKPGAKTKPFYNGPKQANSFNDLWEGAAVRIQGRFDRTTSPFAQRWSYQLLADTVKNLKVVEAQMADAGFTSIGKITGGTELKLSDVLETIMDKAASDLIKVHGGMYKGIHPEMAERVRYLISKEGDNTLTLPKILDDIVSHRFGATKPYNISADTTVGAMIRNGEFDHLVNAGREKAATTAQLASEGTLKALDELEKGLSNPAFVVAESQAPKAAEKIATEQAGEAAGALAKSNTKAVLDATPVAASDSAAQTTAVAAKNSGTTTYRAGKPAIAKDNVQTLERGKATTTKETGMTPEQINKENVVNPDNQLTETTIMGRVGSWVSAKEGWATTRAMVSRARSTTQSMSRHIAGVLNKIERTHTPSEINQGWLIATGKADGVAGSKEAALGMQFRQHMENLFGSSGIGSDIAVKGITVHRSGVTMEEVNRWLGFSGISPEKFSFGNKMIDPVTGQVRVLDNGWYAWEHVDLAALKMTPTEFLSRIEMATTNALTRKSVYEDMIIQFGSKTGGPGLVKYTGAEERLAGIYFPKEITGSIDKMNKFIDDLEKGVQSQMWRNYDEILRLWKSGVTIYSPGHHVRNMIGDTWLSAMSGMNIANINTWKQARLVQNAGKNFYKDAADISALSHPQFYSKATSGTATEGIRLGNGKVLSYEQLYFQAQRDGLLPHAAILEDLPSTAHGKSFLERLPKRVAKPTGGRAQGVARGVSESREHYVRLAHYIDVVKKSSGKNKTTQQILEDAAFTVKKWHPDGSDLTKFERDVMRRLIPFYSWQRKAIPLIIEGAVRNPARTMVYPKALYNFQIAMGIEAPSPYDPFPEDQLFPDWISDMAIGPLLGEANNYWGALSGSNPFVDVLNTFVNNPAKGVGEQLTPAISVPYEVLSGNKFANPDLKTNDRTATIDAAIPGVSHVGRMTNTQPFTGALEALFTGDASKIQGKYGPTEGNTNSVALINYLTGLGLFDMSRPNYIKQAKLEDQQQASDARKAAIANG